MRSTPAQILLSTFNGGRYLGPMLDSLSTQVTPLPILWRDDGSRDNTVALVQKWAKTYKPGVTRLKKNFGVNLGVIESFGALMAASCAPAVFFADQDDVWLPEKTKTYMEYLEKGQKKWGSKTPLLVHGDLAVVDGRGHLIHPSFWRQQALNPRRNDLRYLLLQNFVTGCATLANRALLKAALPLPPETRMHDWWLAQTAAAMGHLIPVGKPLVQYRQHGGNTVGAKTWSVASLAARVWDTQGIHKKSVHDSCAQAGALEKRWGSKLPPKQRSMLRDLKIFPQKNAWGRRLTLWRHGIARHSIFRTIWLYLTV